MKCDECKESEKWGVIFPYYGVAPHDHGPNFQAILKDKSEWPDNFEPDPEGDECGIYYCPNDECENAKPTHDFEYSNDGAVCIKCGSSDLASDFCDGE